MSGGSFYGLLADAVLLLHLAFVLFVVLGLMLIYIGARSWRWVRNPWFRLAHLLAIGVVAMQAWADILCPLTTLEMALRTQAGEAVYAGSFIAHWLQNVLYWQAPAWVFTAIYTAFAALVAGSWFIVRPRRSSWPS